MSTQQFAEKAAREQKVSAQKMTRRLSKTKIELEFTIGESQLRIK